MEGSLIHNTSKIYQQAAIGIYIHTVDTKYKQMYSYTPAETRNIVIL